jgi:hypothetical protein
MRSGAIALLESIRLAILSTDAWACRRSVFWGPDLVSEFFVEVNDALFDGAVEPGDRERLSCRSIIASPPVGRPRAACRCDRGVSAGWRPALNSAYFPPGHRAPGRS